MRLAVIVLLVSGCASHQPPKLTYKQAQQYCHPISEQVWACHGNSADWVIMLNGSHVMSRSWTLRELMGWGDR